MAVLYDHQRERTWCHLDWFGFYREFARIHNIQGRTFVEDIGRRVGQLAETQDDDVRGTSLSYVSEV